MRLQEEEATQARSLRYDTLAHTATDTFITCNDFHAIVVSI